MKKLVEYKKQKLEMERELFGRFTVVLNSKKEYIQQLEDRLAGIITFIQFITFEIAVFLCLLACLDYRFLPS
jgi:hypothetical protein